MLSDLTPEQLKRLDNMKCPWKNYQIAPGILKDMCIKLLNVKSPRKNSKRNEIREKIIDFVNDKITFPFTKEEVEIFFFTEEKYVMYKKKVVEPNLENLSSN